MTDWRMEGFKASIPGTYLGVIIIVSIFLLSCQSRKNAQVNPHPIKLWLTTADQNALLEEKSSTHISSNNSISETIIEVDTAIQYQTVEGFGYTLTGGSAYLINQKLTAEQRNALLRELFSTEGIGISYLRISIGASDLDDQVFSYADLPRGRVDTSLSSFSLAHDEENLIPILKEILGINSKLKIMGSPWSAPAWMKTNGAVKGGSLKKEYYPVYAMYFVKYIQGMAAHGIAIDAITIQNEPENPHNTPSMLMTAGEQAEFIKQHLGPAFQQAGIKTKILLFDHNCDNPDYPISILNDADARKYVDGSAFHLYLGEITALSRVHEAHPDKSIYFTEQWTSSEGEFGGDLQWHVRNLIVGAMRNWSKTVLEWNLAADPDNKPYTSDGGCDKCLGALTIGDTVTRNVSYYIIGHASKFIRPGSVRVSSTQLNDFQNVAFVTPEGKTVLIVLNDSQASTQFTLKTATQNIPVSIPLGAVATLVW